MKLSKATRLKMRLAKLGTRRPKWVCLKISKSHTGLKKPWSSMPNEKNPGWKGQRVGYRGLHYWVRRYLGKPDRCSNKYCKGVSGYFAWANRDRKYRRSLKDWIMLCGSCHTIADRNRLKICSNTIVGFKMVA